jgi:AcrR family transcriptional regulator
VFADYDRVMPPSASRGSTDGSTLWTRPTRGARGPAPGYSLADIAAAGIDLAERGGLTAVSMRALAGSMGTSAGSLYRYVASRDELIDLMVDSIEGHHALQLEPGPWDDQVVALASARLAVHRRPPWLADAVAGPRVLGPNGLDSFDAFLAALEPIPSPTTVKMELIAIIVGVVTLFSARDRANAQRQVTPTQMLSAIDPGRHHRLVAALNRPSPDDAPQDLFERTIRAVAHGLLGHEPTTSTRP